MTLGIRPRSVADQLAHAAREDLAHSSVAKRTHLVLIPSFNSGVKLIETVQDARRHWAPVWVVVDGSTDGSVAALENLAESDPDLRIFVLPYNQGKGAEILHGLQRAAAEGFTH